PSSRSRATRYVRYSSPSRRDASGMTSPPCPGGRGMSSASELRSAALIGSDQGNPRAARVETQMSTPPVPPSRLEANQSVVPPASMAELDSKPSLLMIEMGS